MSRRVVDRAGDAAHCQNGGRWCREGPVLLGRKDRRLPVELVNTILRLRYCFNEGRNLLINSDGALKLQFPLCSTLDFIKFASFVFFSYVAGK